MGPRSVILLILILLTAILVSSVHCRQIAAKTESEKSQEFSEELIEKDLDKELGATVDPRGSGVSNCESVYYQSQPCPCHWHGTGVHIPEVDSPRGPPERFHAHS